MIESPYNIKYDRYKIHLDLLIYNRYVSDKHTAKFQFHTHGKMKPSSSKPSISISLDS